jgi:cytoskeletal protein CcmA (bactofilin family)
MNKPAPPPPTAAVEKRTLVEEGTQLKGSLTSTCPILVHGSVEGDLEGPSLNVSSTGTVKGTIVTGSLKSEGRISGHFDVESAQLAGTVEANSVITANSLDLRLSKTNGRLELTFGTSRKGS